MRDCGRHHLRDRRLATLAALLALAPSIADAELAAKPRAPLSVAINLPAKQFASASVSEIVDIVDAVVRRSTDLKIKVVPQAVVDPCAAQGAAAVECLAKATREGRFLLMISTIDETHVVSLLVDLERSATVVASTLPTELPDRAALETYFADFFDRDLAPIFERAGARTFGGVELVISNQGGAQVSLDGVALGGGEGTVSIRDVPAGRHVVRVEQEGFEPWETEVDVRPLELARLTATLQSTSIALNRSFRQATFYGGLIAFAAGVALTAGSFFDDSSVCFGADCPPSYERKYLLPIGYSVAGMGAAWTLGAWLGDEDAFPWIELLAGVVVFGVSYGVTWAAEARCSECQDRT